MIDVISLLGPGGNARTYFRYANDESDEWVEDFFDTVVEALEQQAVHASDIQEMLGAYRANYTLTPGGDIQLNIQYTQDSGWRCYTAPTLIGALNQLWTHKVMLENLDS